MIRLLLKHAISDKLQVLECVRDSLSAIVARLLPEGLQHVGAFTGAVYGPLVRLCNTSVADVQKLPPCVPIAGPPGLAPGLAGRGPGGGGTPERQLPWTF